MAQGRVVVRSDQDDHVLFRVFKAFYPGCSPGAQPFTRHFHNEIEISAIMSGSGIYTCEDRDYPFSEGDIFLLSANDEHYFKYIDDEKPPSLVVLQFDPQMIWSPANDWFDRRFVPYFMPGAHYHFVPGDDGAAASIRSCLDTCFDACREQEYGFELLLKSRLLAILACLVRYFRSSSGQTAQPNPIHEEHLKDMDASMRYILKHLQDELTLSGLAREMGISRSYYSTLFKRLNGVSVWEYITMQRVGRAQYLLETTSDSVTEICGKSGFNSIVSFNRCFKRMTSKTPREYRRELAESSPD